MLSDRKRVPSILSALIRKRKTPFGVRLSRVWLFGSYCHSSVPIEISLPFRTLLPAPENQPGLEVSSVKRYTFDSASQALFCWTHSESPRHVPVICDCAPIVWGRTSGVGATKSTAIRIAAAGGLVPALGMAAFLC